MAEDGSGRRFYRRATFWIALSIPALIAVYAALLYFTLPRTHGTEVSLQEFFAAADSGSIDSAVLLNVDDRVFFVQDGQDRWVSLPATQQYTNTFVQGALDQDIPLDIDQQELKTLVTPATYLVPALIIVAAFLLFFLLLRSGSSPFLRARGRRGESDEQVTFDDVAGIDEAVAEVREVRDYLMAPERFADIGAQPPRGILLMGPPGTGKTLLARAVAGEAGVPFFSISGTDFVEMYVGVGAARVRDLFRRIRDESPAILFVDELDAVGRTRAGGTTAGQEERDQTLNQLLVELDGFQGSTGTVIIGATNRPDVLDPALLRRGRFDRHIIVDRPDRAGREAILAVHARGKRLDPTVDLEQIAAETAGFTGADLASVLNEAGLLAARRGGQAIGRDEIDAAVDRLLSGGEGRVRLLTPDEKRTVAYHEAGHAVTAWALQADVPVTKISVVSRGRSLGQTRMLPEEEKFVVARGDFDRRLAVMMGGRAAEELVLGEPASTSKDDLRRATALARKMVCELGMSDALGRRSLGIPGSPFLDNSRHEPDYSGEAAALIDREIGELLDDAFSRAFDVLRAHRATFDELARRLVEDETLYEADLAPLARAVGAVDEPAEETAHDARL